MAITITSKGQVTIPKPFRDRLGLEPGSRVEFTLNAQGDVVLARADGERPKNRFEALLGFAGPGPSTDEVMAMLRGED